MKIPSNETQVLFYCAPSKQQYYIITQITGFQKYVLYEADSVGTIIQKLKTATVPTDFEECY